MKIEVGKKYKVSYGNRNDKLLHIVGIVEGQFIYRTWGKHRRYWAYGVYDPVDFEFWIEKGILTCTGKITILRNEQRI